jgi:hypothetical protein
MLPNLLRGDKRIKIFFFSFSININSVNHRFSTHENPTTDTFGVDCGKYGIHMPWINKFLCSGKPPATWIILPPSISLICLILMQIKQETGGGRKGEEAPPAAREISQ